MPFRCMSIRNVFLSPSLREALVFSKLYAPHTMANAANLLQPELLVLAAISLQYLLEASKWTANSVFGVAGFVLPLHGMYGAYCSTGWTSDSWIILRPKTLGWQVLSSLQSSRFLTETLRVLWSRPRSWKAKNKRLQSTSPLKSVFDSPQPSGSFNVQDGGIALFLKKIMDCAAKKLEG